MYHANLFKKYFAQEEINDAAVGMSATITGAVAHETTEIETPHDNNDDLVEIGGYISKETLADVTVAPSLNETQQEEFMDLARQYSDLCTEAPGTTNLIQHHIKLTTDESIRCKPYPLPYSMREDLKKYIDSMIKMRVIRESHSSYAAPVVIVKKRDQTNRVCVDYRKLNKITVFDPEPMPTAADLFHKLNSDKYFSKIDLRKGYWQVTILEDDVHKTAFVTPDGSYEFLKMPFGMINSAATLKCGIKKLLVNMDGADYYWDDILVHSPTWEKHLEALTELFKRLALAK